MGFNSGFKGLMLWDKNGGRRALDDSGIL